MPFAHPQAKLLSKLVSADLGFTRIPRHIEAVTDELKREAVKLVKQPKAKVTHTALDLGIEQSVMRR
jgi:hypothetical protein